MTDLPFQGDAVGLVEEYRAGRRSPVEELEMVYDAIDTSDLNAVSFTDPDAAREAARHADVSLPFGGVPIGVKCLTPVTGWPDDEASVPLRGRVATTTATMIERLETAGGAVLAAQTTASEFGGVNVSRNELHGVTHNPWQHGITAGGSSGGSAAAVVGGILPIASGGDGGGSIRIPAGFTGLVGLKGTFGRIPRGPNAAYGNLTVSTGCVSRSVRDTARWFDVAAGHDPTDPLSLPREPPWEPRLGAYRDELRGARVAVADDWGSAFVSPIMWELLEERAIRLIDDAGLRRIDGTDLTLPRMGGAWSISGMLPVAAELADRWPDCADELTWEMRNGLRAVEGRYGPEARDRIERRRTEVNAAMARIFDPSDGVDFVITASNPDVAFDADGPLPKTFGGVEPPQGRANNGLLTFPANLHGNPAISVPAGFLDGLPIGLQIIGRHFSEPLLLDLALTLERAHPWPLTAHRDATA